MTKTVEFLFDFGSPNAYLSHRVAPAIEVRAGARFVYTPVLLGGVFKLTNNQSPIVAFANVRTSSTTRCSRRAASWRAQARRVHLQPALPVNTLQIMRGAVVAEAEGVLAAYVEAVFQHMWERPRRWTIRRSSAPRWPNPGSTRNACSRAHRIRA